MKGLVGKAALGTGASSGIGQAIAIRLAQEGCNLAINYRKDVEEAEQTKTVALQKARESGQTDVRARLIQGDAANEDDIIRVVKDVTEYFGGLDILINNAGIQSEYPSHDIPVAARAQRQSLVSACRTAARAKQRVVSHAQC